MDNRVGRNMTSRRQNDPRAARYVTVAAMIFAVMTGSACGGTLDRVRHDKAIRLAYREDAPPFSYKNKIGEPAGFIVDVCRSVATKLAQQLKLPALKVAFVPVTAMNRFEAIEQHKADLLCGPTSATLSRRALVDFSIPTYVDGASLIIRTDGPRELQEMSGRKIGVLGGTTTQDELHTALDHGGVTADVVLVKSYSQGIAMLDAGTIAAFFGDRDVLVSVINQSAAPAKLALSNAYLTVEPYALALAHGDDDFRLAVDRALSQIYRSGEIVSIFSYDFGRQAKPSALLQSLYIVSALPE
jgi:ABC-type amino acid transport substrate-binding protein